MWKEKLIHKNKSIIDGTRSWGENRGNEITSIGIRISLANN